MTEHRVYVSAVRSATMGADAALRQLTRALEALVSVEMPSPNAEPVHAASIAAHCDALACADSLEAVLRRLEAFHHDTVAAYARHGA